jgi:predicted RNase H-like HicB family nuclease
MAGATLSASNHAVDIALSVQVWKEGASHVAYTPELDISSCGKTPSQAKSRLREAVSLFIEEAARQGTLGEILEEAGFERHGKTYRPRPILARERMRLTLPAA